MKIIYAATAKQVKAYTTKVISATPTKLSFAPTKIIKILGDTNEQYVRKT